MTLKPPTKTFPKLVMKEWPPIECFCGFVDNGGEAKRLEHQEYHRLRDKALSDFTRVLEGVEGQKETPLRKQESDHG